MRDAEGTNVKPWRIDECAPGLVFHDVVGRVAYARRTERTLKVWRTDGG